MNDKRTPPPSHDICHYRDYHVHLVIEDEDNDYMLKIGTVYERYSGELTGDSVHGTLVLTRLGSEIEPERFMPYKDWQATTPPIQNDAQPIIR